MVSVYQDPKKSLFFLPVNAGLNLHNCRARMSRLPYKPETGSELVTLISISMSVSLTLGKE